MVDVVNIFQSGDFYEDSEVFQMNIVGNYFFFLYYVLLDLSCLLSVLPLKIRVKI